MLEQSDFPSLEWACTKVREPRSRTERLVHDSIAEIILGMLGGIEYSGMSKPMIQSAQPQTSRGIPRCWAEVGKGWAKTSSKRVI